MSSFLSLPLLIEPADLVSRLDAPELRLVDVGVFSRYKQTHIQGALCVEPAQIQNKQSILCGLLPSEEELEQLFGQLGHKDGVVYVVYDDEGGGWAGRFIWLLDSIDYPHYHYLNGGLHAWFKAGYPLVTEQYKVTATTPHLEIIEEPTASLAYMQSRLGADDLVVWDARSAAEFSGEKLFSARGGHIPQAVNFEWLKAMDPEAGLRIRSDIAERLQQLGITPDKEIITHCQGHHRSGFTYLVAKVLGYPRIKAYAGAWLEWGNREDTPVEI